MNRTLIISIVLIIMSITSSAQQRLKIWYDHPANSQAPDGNSPWESDSEWLKALPIGNGSLGAMIFGDVNKERIQINEKTVWSGSPDDNNNPEAADSLQCIRQLLFEGKYREASLLTEKTQVCRGSGSGRGAGNNEPYGCYQTLGDILLDFGTDRPYSDYRKELDLSTGLVTISYSQDKVNYKREIFASYPDRAIIIRLTADKKKAINFSAELTRPEKYFTSSEKDHLLMTGMLSNGKGAEGLQYAARLKVISKGGLVSIKDRKVSVVNGNDVVMILTAGTNYKPEYPNYFTGDNPLASTLATLRNVSYFKYATLLSRHLQDYRSLFDRVRLKLSEDKVNGLPTDVLLKNPDDLHLQELYFQFGRYLLISSSRNGSLPANLQGIWANRTQTAWNCDYHTNINLQMNYWPADVANLSDCFMPFAKLVESLVGPGEKTAAIQYKLNGWCTEAITNVWGYTSPGEGTGWGLYVAGGAWLCNQLWDHYEYTGDREYLGKIYPILLKSAEFYLGWLVKDPESGKLVSGPSTSPENQFYAPDGSKGSVSMGPSHDQELIQELFSALLKAGALLHDGDPLLLKVDQALKNLLLPGIGADGRLKEWKEEFKEVEPQHRHVSHLYMLYPGSQIDPNKNPELANAARKTLEARSDVGTGWSLAWKINFWARLQDGDRAYQLLKGLLSPASGYTVQMSNAGGTYQNLFCGHPPFQIDGNFGGTAGICEMLLQSHLDEIHLLPALPNAWEKGRVKGLKARGNFEINMQWQNHSLSFGTIKSNNGGLCKIRTSVPIAIQGVKVKYEKTNGGYLTLFNTEKGKWYSIITKKELNGQEGH